MSRVGGEVEIAGLCRTLRVGVPLAEPNASVKLVDGISEVTSMLEIAQEAVP